jgi:hypothetical protein
MIYAIDRHRDTYVYKYGITGQGVPEPRPGRQVADLNKLSKDKGWGVVFGYVWIATNLSGNEAAKVREREEVTRHMKGGGNFMPGQKRPYPDNPEQFGHK